VKRGAVNGGAVKGGAVKGGAVKGGAVRAGNPRRELAVAVVLAVLGGGLALFAASRTWVVIETPRPAPLPSVEETRSGRDAVPWAAAMAFVGLAGGIALLATKRIGRLVVGAIVALSGAVMIAGGVAGWRTTGETFQDVEVAVLWPAASIVGGVAALLAGVLAVARGRHWAQLGAKYDAPGTAKPAENDVWDALDRGEDPTA
jgi:uncharacterized membrane protein (TIGR02234 family)